MDTAPGVHLDCRESISCVDNAAIRKEGDRL